MPLRPGERITVTVPAVSPVQRSWTLREPKSDPDALAEALGLPPLLARLLANRGVTPDVASPWLEPSLRALPDPRQMTDMDAAVERTLQALDAGERIVVHGDYDVDGCTSTAVLVHFLRRVGADVGWYAPHRLRDGYGIQVHTMERLADEGATLVITCDNGTSAHEAIAAGNARGVDTLVIDHHRLPPTLPDTCALLNPKRDGDGNPFEDLAAVGVSFLYAVAVRARLRELGRFAERAEPDLREYLEIVALGTVADLAPLRGVNRILVSAGLRLMRRRRHLGVNSLLEVARIEDGEPVLASHLGFQLGPRINAAGRLDEAAHAVELLLSEQPDEARRLAERLDATNKQRRSLEQQVWDDSLRQAEPLVEQGSGGLVLWSADWHPGVIGIVASKVMRHFHRPALLLSLRDGKAVGSGRCIPGIDLFAVLERYDHLFERWGGHRAAAGVTLLEGHLHELREAFLHEAFADAAEDAWEPQTLVDAEIDLSEVDWGLHEALSKLAPFGLGNAEPCFVARGLRPFGPKLLAGGRGIRMRLRGDRGPALTALGWGLGVDEATLPERIDAAFSLQVNHWRGRSELELRLREIRPSSR